MHLSYAWRMPSPCSLVLVAAVFTLPLGVLAQDPVGEPVRTSSAAGVDRISGIEASSKIPYVQFILPGVLRAPVLSATAPAARPPSLVGQCSLRLDGKYVFEVFAGFGAAAPLSFTPPWKPSTKNDLFPPRTEKFTLTMEFLGYTHVKPLRRQWEMPVANPQYYRYNNPGGSSSNLEEIAYDLRYLLALPTLRLTLDKQTAEFLTTPWLNEIRKEPLCRAAFL